MAHSSENEKTVDNKKKLSFPIVGIGASAGGLKAFETLFDNLPDTPEMAFVLVQHLDPHHESELAEILQNHTKMPVTQVENRVEIAKNSVYVIPPGHNLSIKDGVLHLTKIQESRGQRAPIDLFFRSLADDQGENAICLILSGTGNDGALGLKRIKEQGGVVLVQTPTDAEYDGMPRSAINTNLVDLAAPTAELARKLVAYHQSAERIQFPDVDDGLADEEAGVLQRVFTQLQSQTGTDFSHYKRSTLLRRLQRRMQVNQVADLPAYLELLRGNEKEARSLFKDLLISVTNFFRDPQMWEALAEKVIPALFEDKEADERIRVWVPGCATGEEAFSLAILLLEEARRHERVPELQIFATDLDEDALVFARRGLYPETIATDVTPERLKRFFEKEGNGYRVRQEIQEIILFAPHNLIYDAPFARLDLISCRNLLIYLEREIQQHVFQIFRYALGKSGYLVLGGSESAEQVADWFVPMEKKYRIYRTRPGRLPMPYLPVITPYPEAQGLVAGRKRAPGVSSPSLKLPSLNQLHRDLMLTRYAPPSVLVDRDYQICYKFGDIGRYLRHQEGEPSLNILDNISEQMSVELRTGLFTAFRHQEAARPRKIHLQLDDETEWLLLRIEPVPGFNGREEELALVIFESLSPAEGDQGSDANMEADPGIVQQLEEELKELRHRLQTTIEEYETSNEELKTSNEELQSINEELRSTTEELETSREELRSTNEELISLNQELKYKVEALNRANSDLENLIEATNIATIFLNRDLCLQRYTPPVTEVFNVIPSDIGRPFHHISHKVDYQGLPELAEEVLQTLKSVEEEVSTQDGRWYLLQIRPYRTLEDRINGVVITLVDITVQVQAEQLAKLQANQQTVVAELGLVALRGLPLHDVIDLAVYKIANTLDVEFAKMLKLQPNKQELLLLAGVGWQEGLVGSATVSTGNDSQAGFTLQNDQPIIVEDLRTEKRFSGPPLLIDHNVVSGISVVIQGLHRPFGVLGAHTRQFRAFTPQDAAFMQGVANVLGTAIEQTQIERERQRVAQNLRESEERLQRALMQAPIPTLMMTEDGTFLLINRATQKITGYTPEEIPTLTVWSHLVYGSQAAEMIAYMEGLFNLEEHQDEREFEISTKDQEQRTWHFYSAPLGILPDGRRAVVSMATDITERKRVEAELRIFNEDLETRILQRTRQVRALASSLIMAEQRERERISQVLHDDLQQLLHAVQIRMTILEDEMAKSADANQKQHLAELQQLSEQALTITRSLTVVLSPPVLEGGGLIEALNWLVAYMKNTYDLQVDISIAEEMELANDDLRELAFQIIRELLFNVVKHAEVEKASIKGRQEAGVCILTVEDKGSGFDLALIEQQKDHSLAYGLRSIRERLELFNGSLEIKSQPGVGTHITLQLPSYEREEGKP